MYFNNPKGWALLKPSNKRFTHSGVRRAGVEGKEKGTVSIGTVHVLQVGVDSIKARHSLRRLKYLPSCWLSESTFLSPTIATLSSQSFKFSYLNSVSSTFQILQHPLFCLSLTYDHPLSYTEYNKACYKRKSLKIKKMLHRFILFHCATHFQKTLSPSTMKKMMLYAKSG